jgi:hypothetical protein
MYNVQLAGGTCVELFDGCDDVSDFAFFFDSGSSTLHGLSMFAMWTLVPTPATIPVLPPAGHGVSIVALAGAAIITSGLRRRPGMDARKSLTLTHALRGSAEFEQGSLG